MGTATDTAMAQQARDFLPALLAAALSAIALPVCAGEWTITPSISINETMNRTLGTSMTLLLYPMVGFWRSGG